MTTLVRLCIVRGVMETYSIYEAKAHFSEIIRQVREGETVTVTYRGKPVAEIRPIAEPAQTIESRLDEMERQGTLVRSTIPRQPLRRGTPQPGALERFLADRNE